MFQNKLFLKKVCFLFALFNLILFALTFNKFQYLENILLYLLLFLICNFYFIFSIYKFSNFFAVVMSFFIYAGFFMKLSLNLIFLKNKHFFFNNLTHNEITEALSISVISIFSIFLGSHIFQTDYSESSKFHIGKIKLKNFYKILFYFSLILLVLCIINFIFGYYQRGVVSSNYLLSLFFSYNLQIILPIILSIFIYNFHISKQLNYKNIIYIFILYFFIYCSILSRNFAVHAFLILLIYIIFIPNNINSDQFYKNITLSILISIILIILNLKFVSISRDFVNFNKGKTFDNISESINRINNYKKNVATPKKNEDLKEIFVSIVLDRFIGIDEVSQVVKIKNKDFNILKNSLKKDYSKYSYFDKLIFDNNLGENHYLDNQNFKRWSKRNNTPGIIAFLSMSGSYIFIFTSCFIISLLVSFFEKKINFRIKNFWLSFFLTYYISNKIIHFGNPLTIPKLFLTIAVTLVILIIFQNYFKNFYTKFFYR